MTSSQDWHPTSWAAKPVQQEVKYDNQQSRTKALSTLSDLPPIVLPTEIVKLRASLRDVALGKAFLLQGGDCAELFSYCNSDTIDAKIKLLLQMSLVLIWGANVPVVRIARMAGQYAKPRSSPMEKHEGKEIPSFRGDILNGFDPAERQLDPGRLVDAYFHSAATLNYTRAQVSAGIADLHNPFDWGLGYVRDPSLLEQYSTVAGNISQTLRFMRTIGADTSPKLKTIDLYMSHEALVLDYEAALTRRMKHPANRADLLPDASTSTDNSGWYNTSAHFIWVGDRTRDLDSAHIEFVRGVENPIGIKVGPSMACDELVRLLDLVNPRKEIGKVTLITRYGESKVDTLLGPHIDAVKESGHVVVWQCDPMHGNTKSTSSGVKTRHFSSILSELSSALRIHREHGSVLGGMHLELTGDLVTECTGGGEELKEDDLSLNYQTHCDPRLNERQALEMAFLIARHLKGEEGSPQDAARNSS